MILKLNFKTILLLDSGFTPTTFMNFMKAGSSTDHGEIHQLLKMYNPVLSIHGRAWQVGSAHAFSFVKVSPLKRLTASLVI